MAQPPNDKLRAFGARVASSPNSPEEAAELGSKTRQALPLNA
jgi:hypothetical protein